MKIAIIADIHENFHNLMRFYETLEEKEYDIKQIFFLGDFINSGIAYLLAEEKIPVFAIWGNNDGDRASIQRRALKPGSSLTMAKGEFATVNLEGRSLFLSHYPSLIEPLASSKQYDALFYGHDHKVFSEDRDGVLVLNPGEISAHKTGRASFAIYDTHTNHAEIVFITNIVTLRTPLVAKWYDKIDFNQ